MIKISWNYIFAILAFLIVLIFGMILGVGLTSNSPIVIDNKIRYSEVLNWITTLTIGFIVGYVLKNQFENNKVVKSYLLDDIKKIAEDIIDIKEYCYSFKSQHLFNSDQRKEIDAKINILDKRITVFCDFLKHCYKDQHKQITGTLIDFHNTLNKKITGDSFYSDNIPDAYFDGIMSHSSKFESELRILTLKIIKQM